MKLSALSIWIAVFILSCNKKDTMPDCGCEGPSYQELKNVKAAYIKSGFIYSVSEEDTIKRYVKLCGTVMIDPAWQYDPIHFNFILSGQVKLPCRVPGVDNIETVLLFAPTEIEKK
jgi:hypothetical protein